MIVCNGRTMSASLTGVQRYVTEVMARITGVDIIRPHFKLRGPLGHLWEQSILPLRVGKQLLWSPGNTGPLVVRRQVVTVHDLATMDYPEDFSKAFNDYYNWLLPRLLPRVAAVITASEFTKTQIIKRFGLPPEKITAIPLGVDHERFYRRPEGEIAALRKKLSLPPRYILFLGTLTMRKNINRLIDAWAKVQHLVSPETELVIAGGIAPSRIFSAMTLPALPPRTRLLGRVDDNDIPALFSGAALFAFPSLYEGFGLPVLEAMACGAPCLVSNAAALPEVVGTAAIQVNALDVDAMAHELKELLNTTSLLQKLSEVGLVRAKEFRWGVTAAATGAILRGY
jgi:glycosyltransferase involved in cell wall biosynthesis